MEMERIVVGSYIKPVNAFKKLEAAKLLRQNVYISGATGFGKTELIRQYLGREKYIYILCTQNQCDLSVIPHTAGRSVTVVVDNVNAIESADKQRQILELCRAQNLWVIVIGRSKTPSWLYDTMVTRNMLLITEEDLLLSEESIDGYLRSQDILLSPEELRYLRKKSEGNPFALVYTIQRLLSGARVGADLYDENSVLFQNYLVNGVISELNSELMSFLLKISIVDDFSESLAIVISGDPTAHRLIEGAMDSGNYIDRKNGIYTIRAQMLSALRKKAKIVYSDQELHQYAVLAGGFYEASGEDDKALALYARYNESPRIRELLIRNSRKNPETGYFIEMRDYYQMLSEQDIRSSPYLMSAMSMLYSLLMDFEKSEFWYGELKKYKDAATGTNAREALCLLAYLDISLPGRGSANLLKIILDGYRLMTEKSIAIPELSVTSNLPSLMNGGKDFCEWSKNDKKIAAAAGGILSVYLGKYGKGLVNAALAESLYEKGGDPYEVMSLISKARLEADAGGKTELSFAATGTLFRQYILLGEPENARSLLLSFENRARNENLKRLYPVIEAMRIRVSLMEGDAEAAEAWMHSAPDENEQFIPLYRYLYLTKIRCYIAVGQYGRAIPLMESLRYYAHRCDRTYIQMELGILSAIVRFRTGAQWKEDFIRVLEKICEYRFIPILSEFGTAVYDLLNQCEDLCKANEKIDPKWFARVRSETGRVARRYPMYLKSRTVAITGLQPMDIRILTCLADGLSVQKTAEKLSVNYETLRSRIKEIYRRLGARNKVEAVMTAREANLI